MIIVRPGGVHTPCIPPDPYSERVVYRTCLAADSKQKKYGERLYTKVAYAFRLLAFPSDAAGRTTAGAAR